MNRLCLNLDLETLTFELFKKLFKQTEDYVEYYKINLAFVKDDLLIKQIVKYVADNSFIEVILDAKYGDIENTNIQHHNYVEYLGVDGVTLNPFTGLKSLAPFLGNHYNPYILLSTTNKEQEEWQKLLAKKTIEFAKTTMAKIICPSDQIDFVKSINPDAKILCPGIGHQGGQINDKHKDVIYCVGRSVLHSNNWNLAIQYYRKKIDRVNFILEMRNLECIREEKIELSSGETSEIYFDFRKAFGENRSSPLNKWNIRDRIITALSLYCQEKKVKNIVAVAEGGIAPAAIVASKLNLNFAWVRNQQKKHGTRNQIEGFINPSERTLLFDDVITTGNSINNALIVLAKNYQFSNDIDVYCILDRTEEQKTSSLFKYQSNW